jgi:acetolactate synthase-1/2/3 large subunit
LGRIHGAQSLVSVSNDDLGVSLDPSPEFGKIAQAAGGAWWARLGGDHRGSMVGGDDVRRTLAEAIRQVREERKCAVVEVVLEPL